MTTFYIIRHGETDWNKEKKIQGHIDIPLNKTGELQAKEAAKKFRHIKFDLAFSSDLLRAKRTAEIIAQEHALEVETTERLRERHFGTLQGQPSQLLLDYLESLKNLSNEERQKHRPEPKTENDEELISRVFTFLREVAINYPDKTVLIGTHGGVLMKSLIHLGFCTYEQAVTSRLINGGYAKVTSDGVEFFVEDVVGLEQRASTEL